MTAENVPVKPDQDRSTKKPYQRPKLVVYGDLREITRQVGTRGAMDGLLTLKTTL